MFRYISHKALQAEKVRQIKQAIRIKKDLQAEKIRQIKQAIRIKKALQAEKIRQTKKIMRTELHNKKYDMSLLTEQLAPPPEQWSFFDLSKKICNNIEDYKNVFKSHKTALHDQIKPLCIYAISKKYDHNGAILSNKALIRV